MTVICNRSGWTARNLSDHKLEPFPPYPLHPQFRLWILSDRSNDLIPPRRLAVMQTATSTSSSSPTPKIPSDLCHPVNLPLLDQFPLLINCYEMIFWLMCHFLSKVLEHFMNISWQKQHFRHLIKFNRFHRFSKLSAVQERGAEGAQLLFQFQAHTQSAPALHFRPLTIQSHQGR